MKKLMLGAILAMICVYGANALTEAECDVTPGMNWDGTTCVEEESKDVQEWMKKFEKLCTNAKGKYSVHPNLNYLHGCTFEPNESYENGFAKCEEFAKSVTDRTRAYFRTEDIERFDKMVAHKNDSRVTCVFNRSVENVELRLITPGPIRAYLVIDWEQVKM